MSNKLLEALNAVVTELRFLSPIEFHKAIEEASKSEFAQTINLLNNFTNHIINTRSIDDGDTLSLFLPIENKPVIPKTDTEDLPNTGLVSKTPYRDITTYREEWHINPIDK